MAYRTPAPAGEHAPICASHVFDRRLTIRLARAVPGRDHQSHIEQDIAAMAASVTHAFSNDSAGADTLTVNAQPTSAR
jgi:hypothetical protein